MYQQRDRNEEAVDDELGQWRRRPVRIHVFPAGERERVHARLQGMISEVNEGQQRLVLDLAVPFYAGWFDADLVVEILLPQGVLRFDTQALPPMEALSYRIQVAVPAARESFQRRTHSRVDVLLSAVIRRSAPTALVAGRILNLSAGGLGMLLPIPLELDERVVVDFLAGDGTRYELPGRVVRSRTLPEGTMTGIQFVDVRAEVAEALNRYVRALLLSEPASPSS